MVRLVSFFSCFPRHALFNCGIKSKTDKLIDQRGFFLWGNEVMCGWDHDSWGSENLKIEAFGKTKLTAGRDHKCKGENKGIWKICYVFHPSEKRNLYFLYPDTPSCNIHSEKEV